jgi:hypothetical protein
VRVPARLAPRRAGARQVRARAGRCVGEGGGLTGAALALLGALVHLGVHALQHGVHELHVAVGGVQGDGEELGGGWGGGVGVGWGVGAGLLGGAAAVGHAARWARRASRPIPLGAAVRTFTPPMSDMPHMSTPFLPPGEGKEEGEAAGTGKGGRGEPAAIAPPRWAWAPPRRAVITPSGNGPAGAGARRRAPRRRGEHPPAGAPVRAARRRRRVVGACGRDQRAVGGHGRPQAPRRRPDRVARPGRQGRPAPARPPAIGCGRPAPFSTPHGRHAPSFTAAFTSLGSAATAAILAGLWGARAEVGRVECRGVGRGAGGLAAAGLGRRPRGARPAGLPLARRAPAGCRARGVERRASRAARAVARSSQWRGRGRRGAKGVGASAGGGGQERGAGWGGALPGAVRGRPGVARAATSARAASGGSQRLWSPEDPPGRPAGAGPSAGLCAGEESGREKRGLGHRPGPRGPAGAQGAQVVGAWVGDGGLATVAVVPVWRRHGEQSRQPPTAGAQP